MKDEKVTFFFPEFSKNYSHENLNLEDHNFFCSWKDLTIRAWVIQTYLRLKELNLNVHISENWPAEGTVVLLANKKSLKELEDNIELLNKDLIIVTIRADEIQWRPMLSDIEIVQNGLFANDRDCFFIPHWPQPGIIKRDTNRGHRIENLVFKGGKGSLDDVFYSDRWFSEVRDRNINIIYNTEHTTTNWTDYGKADIVIAVRPQFRDKYKRSDKPASKLINSWHAEVPALLGSEIAFMELRKSELDYLEVNTVEEGLKAIDLLKTSEEIYFGMIQNGIERAAEFSSSNITNRWRMLLFDIIPTLRDEVSFKKSRLFSGKGRKLFYFFTKKQSSFEYKKRLGNSYRTLFNRKAKY